MRRALSLLAAALVLTGCKDRVEASPAAARSVNPAPPEAPPAPPPPVHTEDVAVPGDLAAVVVRGARAHRLQMLFIPGMCVHPGGYVLSFQHTAAARGDLVALQGDVSCGGDGTMRRWSSDLEAMDRRVDAAFRASGLTEPRELVVIGYSQGAERAQRLVARWPSKYTRAILLASPVNPSRREMARARGVVLMAGTYDVSSSRMRAAVEPFRRAAIPATFLEIPEAHHGSMGKEPERTMQGALDFLDPFTNDSGAAP